MLIVLVLVAVSLSQAMQGDVAPQERRALMELFAATGGDRWSNRGGWGDGSGTSVETYARQGPVEVWSAQQLFLGLLSEAVWERESRRPKCDFQK